MRTDAVPEPPLGQVLTFSLLDHGDLWGFLDDAGVAGGAGGLGEWS